MAVKKWLVSISYFFGAGTDEIEVKANTEKKAKQIAIDKCKKEHGCNFVNVLMCKQKE